MFEKFTDRARRVIVLAQEEARALNHNYIGTEHIVLGLMHESDGLGCKALESLGVSLDAVRQQVTEVIGYGQTPADAHIPFTPRAKKVLDFAHREALQLGHSYIGTEHILLGLIREGGGVGAQVLAELGADLNEARRAVIKLLSGYEGGVSPESLAAPVREPGRMGPRSAPSEIHKPPLCPSCRRGLDGNLRSASLPAEGTSRLLFVVYCTGCGVVIETRIEEPES